MHASPAAALRHLTARYAAPDYVKQASSTDLFGGAAMTASHYADRGRTLPIHTPAATWRSAAAYADQGEFDIAVIDRIKMAAVIHGVAGVWEDVRRRSDALHKEAAEAAQPKCYALPQAKRYPIDTAEQIKAAADYFLAYADQFAHEDRRTFAAQTVKAAKNTDALGPEILIRLEREAGLGRAAVDADRAFAVRAKLAHNPAVTAVLERIAQVAAGDPVKAASRLRELDRIQRWDLPDPFNDLTGPTPTSARRAAAGVVKAASGAYYRREDLERVPDAALEAVLGQALLTGPASRAGLLKSAHAGAFEALLADHGVVPVEAAQPRVDWAAEAAVV